MHLLTTLLALLSSTTGVWPLSPTPPVVHSFEPPSKVWSAGHRGVDLLGSPGQLVGAAAEGVVTFAGRIAGVGTVVVSHGDTRSTYQPVAADVVAGQAVAAGQPLGHLEVSGSHCLPRACLHWGLIRGTEYLDPLTLVTARASVRLLPLDPPPSTVSPVAAQTPLPAPPQEIEGLFSLALSGLAGTVPPFGLPVTPGGEPAGTPSAAGPP